MIICKTPREIEIMRHAGKIVALTHEELKKHIKPGVTTKQLDMIVEKTIKSHGATASFKGYNGFPGSSCISINEELVHGIPKDRVLKDGDIVSIDIGANYKGYHGDSAWTYPVGDVSEDAKRLLDVTEKSLFVGLEQAVLGNRVTDISHAIQAYVEEQGLEVVRDYSGHGIGQNLHEDPSILNYGLPGKGARLKSGMVLAIEPMVNMGKHHVKVLSDDWTVVTSDGSLCAHFEHTVVVKDDGTYDILTTL